MIVTSPRTPQQIDAERLSLARLHAAVRPGPDARTARRAYAAAQRVLTMRLNAKEVAIEHDSGTLGEEYCPTAHEFALRATAWLTDVSAPPASAIALPTAAEPAVSA